MKDFINETGGRSLFRFVRGHTVRGRSGFGPANLLFLPLPANVNGPYLQGAPVHLPAARPERRPDSQPEMQPGNGPAHSWYRSRGKRVMDAALVLATLPLSLPIIAICALALWFEGGMPFYRQYRLGKGGRTFSILKLRTMVRDADQRLDDYLQNDPALRHEWETTQKLKNDPRITRVGGFLRTTSLDELPQLWNVLKGEMSLVGPRPMLPEQLPLYGDPSAYFAQVPGITGIWQVSARNENHFAYRAQIDAVYFDKMDFTQDLSLLFRTVGVVVRRTGY